MNRANNSFIPIPASVENKRPLGKWSGNSYLFERDFPKREQWEVNCNLGLLVSDDFIVIDVDNKPPAHLSTKKQYSENSGINDFQALIDQNAQLPKTLVVCTPSGGKHYYFALTGRDDEQVLKNWTSCMNLGGKLIAVDIRKKGGYVMCPPSKKGTKRYAWETKEDFNVALAPLPQWILRNIVTTAQKNPEHFEAQKYIELPVDNETLSSDDIQIFKTSEYWEDCFAIAQHPDKNCLYSVTASAPYNC
ncbi:hypothetical protein HDU88_000633 [Geranomyces variabilis]|nr:hypothetical protein HDU88_000633 [Geranomyces variabilis]